MKTFVVLFTLNTILLVCGQVNIVPLGDSITYGCIDGCGTNITTPGCVDCQGGYRTSLFTLLTQKGIKFNFVGSLESGPSSINRHHEGHPGWRIDQIQADIVGWMNSYKPEIFLIHLGTNDAGQGGSSSLLIQRMQTLLSTIYKANPQAHIYLASIIHFYCNDAAEATVAAYNAGLPAVVQQFASQGFKISFVDIFNKGGLVQADYGDNCVHPNKNGYDKMARMWASAISV